MGAFCAFLRPSASHFHNNDKSGGQHCFNGGQYGSGVPSRNCHVASLLAMTNRRCVPFYDGSFRTAVPSRDCHVGLRPPRNDKAGGQHRFNGGRYGSGGAFPRLPRRFAPRNDKLGGLLHPEGRSDKLASAFLPCHCGARSALGSPFGRAVTEGD